MARHFPNLLAAVILFLTAIQATATPVATRMTMAENTLDGLVRDNADVDGKIVLVKGERRLRPIFEREARPRQKPREVKPVVKPRERVGVSRLARERSLRRRVDNVRFPERRISASKIALDRLKDVSKAASRPLLRQRLDLERAKLRLDTKRLLPSPRSLGHVPEARGHIRSFVTERTETYYRVFSGDATTGGYLTKVKPKSREWAIQALALPPWNKANRIQKVVVPKGTRLIRSRAMENFGRKGGGEQFLLLSKIPVSNFGKGQEFEY